MAHMKSNIPMAPRARAASVALPLPSTSMTPQRRVALALGAALLASSLCSALGLATARASEEDTKRSKQYKIGAAVLGAASAYYILKGKKTVPGVVAGAGAYYAYKKSQEYKRRGEADRYGYGSGDTYTPDQDRYPDDYASGDYDGGAYDGGTYVGGYGDEPSRGGYDDYASLPGGDYGSGAYGGAYPDYTKGLRAQSNARRTAKAPTKAQPPRNNRAVRVK
jgi:hypothetical protein